MLEKNLKKFRLNNGIKGLYYERKELPIISLSIGFNTGQYWDPPGKEGLFYLTTSLIDKGAKEKDAYKIREFFDKRGAKFEISASRNFLILSFLCKVEFFEEVLKFVYFILRNVEFKDEEIIKEKERIISEILQEKEEPEIVVSKEFYKVLYEGTPFSHPIEGYEETIKLIKREEIFDFYLSRILNSEIFIAGTGYMNGNEVEDLLNDTFGNLKRKNKTDKISFKVKKNKKIKVLKKDINQVFVRLGHFSIKRKDKNFSKLLVSNYILGGGAFASRLYKKIRNEMGYVYSIYTKFYPLDPFKGPYIYAFQTSKENFKDALRIFLQELKKFKEKGPSKRELEEAKGFFKGSIPRETETYSQITQMLLNALKMGLKPFYFYDTLKEILNMDLESLKDFVASFYKYEDLSGVILVPKDYDFNFFKDFFPEHTILVD